MRRPLRSTFSVLCMSALVAACGGGSKPPDPAPSSTLIPIPDPAVACNVLRVTPGDAIQQTFVESEAPSSGATTMAVPGLIAAGKGHLFLAPDLIGVGDTSALPQAYLVAADTASQTQDLLRAVRTHVQQRHQARLGTDLRLVGGSQGACSTIASLRHLAREGTVRIVSAAQQGPYDVYRTFQGALLAAGGAARDAYAMRENLDFLSSHVRNVMTSFLAYGNYAFDPKRGKLTTHTLCVAFQIDDFVGEL